MYTLSGEHIESVKVTQVTVYMYVLKVSSRWVSVRVAGNCSGARVTTSTTRQTSTLRMQRYENYVTSVLLGFAFIKYM